MIAPAIDKRRSAYPADAAHDINLLRDEGINYNLCVSEHWRLM